MARKRKRSENATLGASQKRQKPETAHRDVGENISSNIIRHPVLSLYFPHVLTLRDYLLLKLPPSSKIRRRRLLSSRDSSNHLSSKEKKNRKNGHPNELDASVQKLLDTTLIGIEEPSQEVNGKPDISLSSLRSTTSSSNSIPTTFSWNELVDYAIWSLFHRIYLNKSHPCHLLCDGYERSRESAYVHSNVVSNGIARRSGIKPCYPNSYVSSFKSPVWESVFALVGKNGETIMLNMLLYCGCFLEVGHGTDNFLQICGTPLKEMTRINQKLRSRSSIAKKDVLRPSVHSPSTTPKCIEFARNRIFYAKATLNAKGDVRFGLRHIHVLNRYSDPDTIGHTIHIMMYIFPRQFQLHNVFTCVVNRQETGQPFKDYTLREQEISDLKKRNLSSNDQSPSGSLVSMPKRLRGLLVVIIQKLQRNHKRCSYSELLLHYCPSRGVINALEDIEKGRDGSNPTNQVQLAFPTTDPVAFEIPQPTKSSLFQATRIADHDDQRNPHQSYPITDHALSHNQVSGFCRAVFKNVFPKELFGTASDGESNMKLLLSNIDRFIRLRRFENMNLHEVMQGMKIAKISWLMLPNEQIQSSISLSDMKKRKEIFSELLYYIFDSFLIPLIRSSFYVTESSTFRNRLLYFRHDVWKSLIKPKLTSLKIAMFKELKAAPKSLGYSQIRLMPKVNGFRPIMNLKKKEVHMVNGKRILQKGINSQLAPVFALLAYEKNTQPARLGAAMGSVDDIYTRLKLFKHNFQELNHNAKQLYFVKVDVQSCFDTIPQDALLALVEQLLSESEYTLISYAEMKHLEGRIRSSKSDLDAKPITKFRKLMKAATRAWDFGRITETELAREKRGTIYIGRAMQAKHHKGKLLDLLKRHVAGNMVRIGKKRYRQTTGIPQGSILSSILCNFFYGDFERAEFPFLNPSEGVLFRLVDDFLLITANLSDARVFLEKMHEGSPAYGISVNSEKTLVNFEASINEVTVPRLNQGQKFPYCGQLIDTRTLEISPDKGRRANSTISDSLTVEVSKSPGKVFSRKIQSALKVQMHAMYMDTSFNSFTTVLSNIYRIFIETAMKFHSYLRCLKTKRWPSITLLQGTITGLIDLTIGLVKSKSKRMATPGYHCGVSRKQIEWLGASAFWQTLQRKQSRYREIQSWLKMKMHESEPTNVTEASRMREAARDSGRVFKDCRY